MYQQVLKGFEEKLGSKHPDTLGTVENLANVYRNQGQYEKAEQLYQHVLEGREEKLGSKHPDRLATADELAAVYQSQGRHEDVEKLYIS